MEEIRVENAREFFEKVFAELVCLCNLKALVIAEGGVVKLPATYGGRPIGDVAAELCGPCILVDDGAVQYLAVFYKTEKPLGQVAALLRELWKTVSRGRL
ncbi:hypothetical protein [Pyrobaculum calidifontis]|uniref:Uncharacterized protein n=1 Tax=Pyrobaculum calidifontis (strain DSM 21063 / JCM 11548 / VA1) TaxID=410359 RepID=A3MW38_PYRCJ|nr:hypothetical protein [Pyrobaculum calidifontis]ABO08855.1 conserved hypothetical protein [Pyrobaculum calidifontis JCM 11548]